MIELLTIARDVFMFGTTVVFIACAALGLRDELAGKEGGQ